MGPLVPIEYSAEEMAAVTVPAPAPAPAPVAVAASTTGPSAEELKQLILTIPTKRAELYAAPVQWDVALAHGILADKIKPFISKKMVEYLGEEEPTLVDFIITKLEGREGAEVVEAEMAKVLDDDAQVFTVKLWRMLLFEILRVRGSAS
mmetsp:Transcript_21991/g.50546  ORF Transcript_21991/g.50546 Transcript_21991/m.50546 type:complete len:149 (-) Transcript_21991:946-1392(-)